MNGRIWIVLAGLMALAGSATGQEERKATLTGENGDRGKCTIEVVVDGAAEVQVHGDSAVLRNLRGQPPQWRRFQCSGVMPTNPADFRFAGVDGRGRMDLVRDPRNGGVAVIRIEDQKSGTEGYTFDLTWRGERGQAQDQDRYRREDAREQLPSGERERQRDDRFSTDQAVRTCQDAIRQQAGERLHARDIDFRRTRIDDTPGRRDWVVGAFDVVRRDGRSETYRFSCSVNLENGRVRSAEIEEGGRPGMDRLRGGSNGDVLDSCRRGVEERLRRDGYDRIDFQSLRVDDRPGRRDSVLGSVRAERRDGAASLEFSCAVNLETGELRSVDIRR